MAEVVVFHHAHGLTPGLLAFADDLRAGGHVVHAPDLFEGRVFDDLHGGLAYAEQVGFGEIIERGREAAGSLPEALVYVGFSLGVLPAQWLAQNRAGARGAVLIGSCVPPAELGEEWPANVEVQVHGMDADTIFVAEGDLDAARTLVAETADAELFLYAGDRHLFADRGLPDYDEDATRLLTERVRAFLDAV
ncbi:MAG TPA: dienelactone hydrolase family protein [Egibacteraceae bacterium]|nr:dienelactone hydrolase family protein [Egibacteraceae bacterium]